MKKEFLAMALMNIAAANTEGFTVQASTLEPVTSGFAVALADTQNSFGEEGLNKVIEFVVAHENVNAFGGWLNTDNNEFYFDATVICSSKEEAEAFARANDQIAYFDLNNMEEVRIK